MLMTACASSWGDVIGDGGAGRVHCRHALHELVGDGSGEYPLGLTRRYFANPVVLIAHDDDFESTSWPVTAVINDQSFRGALVILAERSVDPTAPPLQGDTFLDGLTARECQEVLLAIKPPAGVSLRYHV